MTNAPQHRKASVARRQDDREREALAVIATKVLEGIEIGKNMLEQGGKLDLIGVSVDNVSKWSEKHEGADEGRFREAHEEAKAQNLVAMAHFQRIDAKIDQIMTRILWAVVSALTGLATVIGQLVTGGKLP